MNHPRRRARPVQPRPNNQALVLPLLLAALFLAVIPSASARTTIQGVVSVKRVGDFLAEPKQENLSLLQTLARHLKSHWSLFDQQTLEAALFDLDFSLGTPGKKPVLARDWTKNQRSAVADLWQKANDVLAELATGLPTPGQGFCARGVMDAPAMVAALETLLDSPQATQRLRPAQIHKLRYRVIPFLTMLETAALVATLDHLGFVCRAEFRGNSEFREVICAGGKPPAPFTLCPYLRDNALAAMGQIHEERDPQVIIAGLEQYSQYLVLKPYLASAGINIASDVLDNLGTESLLTVNLEPTGDGGVPDVRAIIRVKDPVKLLRVAPGLQQVAGNFGVFIGPQLDAVPSVRIGHFLLGQYALHATLKNDLLLVATSKANVTALAHHIDKTSAGPTQPAPATTAPIHRYWCVRFPLLRAQMELFRKSPLMAGTAPKTNDDLAFADELGELIVTTRILPDSMRMDTRLPFAGSKRAAD